MEASEEQKWKSLFQVISYFLYDFLYPIGLDVHSVQMKVGIIIAGVNHNK